MQLFEKTKKIYIITTEKCTDTFHGTPSQKMIPYRQSTQRRALVHLKVDNNNALW